MWKLYLESEIQSYSVHWTTLSLLGQVPNELTSLEVDILYFELIFIDWGYILEMVHIPIPERCLLLSEYIQVNFPGSNCPCDSKPILVQSPSPGLWSWH